MKRITLTFLLTVLMSMVAKRGFAQICIIEYDGLNYELNDYEGTAQVINLEKDYSYLSSYGIRYEGDITVPELLYVPSGEGAEASGHSYRYIETVEAEDEFYGFSHDTFRVISIGKAFSGNYDITAVTLPNSITDIEDEAFYDS